DLYGVGPFVRLLAHHHAQKTFGSALVKCLLEFGDLSGRTGESHGPRSRQKKPLDVLLFMRWVVVTSSTTAQIQAIANLKVPDDTPANEQVVLSALVRRNIQSWDA